ncbi:MAG: phage tail tape measure protein [Candidatus Heimdallarchaeaceae archaeon]
MNELGKLSVAIGANLKDLEAGLAKSTAMIQKWATDTGRKMTRLGNQLSLKVTAPIALIGVRAGKMAGEFELAMNKVQVVTSASRTGFEAMEQQAKDLALTSVFSAKEIAEGMSFLGMTGFSTVEILKTMPDVVNMAAAANISLGRSADIVTNIMKGYQIGIEDLTHATDVLVKAFTSSNVDLNMLGYSFKYVGPLAKQAGLSFEEAAAVLGKLGDAGLQSTVSGTAFRRMLTRLIDPVGKTKELLDKYGLVITESSIRTDGFIGVLKQFEEAGVSVQDSLAIFKDRAGPAFYSVLQQGSEEVGVLVEKLRKAGGTAKEVAEVRVHGLIGSFRKLKNIIGVLGIEIGESGIMQFVTGLAISASLLVIQMKEMNPEFLRFGVALLVVAAAAGPIIKAGGALLTFLGGLSIVGAGGWVVGLGVALTAAVKLSDKFKDVADSSKKMASDVASSSLKSAAVVEASASDIKEKYDDAFKIDGKLLMSSLMNIGRDISDFASLSSSALIKIAVLAISTIKDVFIGFGVQLRNAKELIYKTFLGITEIGKTAGEKIAIGERIELVKIEISRLENEANNLRSTIGDLYGKQDIPSSLLERLTVVERMISAKKEVLSLLSEERPEFDLDFKFDFGELPNIDKNFSDFLSSITTSFKEYESTVVSRYAKGVEDTGNKAGKAVDPLSKLREEIEGLYQLLNKPPVKTPMVSSIEAIKAATEKFAAGRDLKKWKADKEEFLRIQGEITESERGLEQFRWSSMGGGKKEEGKDDESFFEQIGSEFDAFVKELETPAEAFENVFTGAIGIISNAFGDAFGRMIFYGESFVKSFGSQLKSLAAELVGLLARIGIGWVLSSFGLPGIGSAFAGIKFHKGEKVPYAHDGMNLKKDEVPIIAQAGERILSKEDNKEFMDSLRSMKRMQNMSMYPSNQSVEVSLSDEQGNRLMSWIVNKTQEGRGNGVKRLALAEG